MWLGEPACIIKVTGVFIRTVQDFYSHTVKFVHHNSSFMSISLA